MFKWFSALILGVWLGATGSPGAAPESISAAVPLTPGAECGWARLPDSSEVSAYLGRIAAGSLRARLVRLGTSSGGRPVEALRVSDDPAFLEASGSSKTGKLTVMMVGSQHGTEPAGCEALQRIAAELTSGDLQPYLKSMDFILIVNANPDGRDLHRRGNASRVNLSTGFTALTQPECRAVVASLQRDRPHLLLDLHESAILKRKSLGAQGYMTDFEAQVEVSNHPAIDPGLRTLAAEELLPRVISKVRTRGLACQHYVGEILDLQQPVTHGGLSLRNLRNYASIRNTIGILIENRLDPPGDWPTPRNIGRRVDKQLLGVAAVLESCVELAPRIIGSSAAARRLPEEITEVPLAPEYVADRARPEITLGLTGRVSGVSRGHRFRYLPVIDPGPVRISATALYITDHHERLAGLLTLHGIPFSRLESGTVVRCQRQELLEVRRVAASNGIVSTSFRIREHPDEVELHAGDLRVEAHDPSASLALLLLDLRSTSTVFKQPEFQVLLQPGAGHFVVRAVGR